MKRGGRDTVSPEQLTRCDVYSICKYGFLIKWEINVI